MGLRRSFRLGRHHSKCGASKLHIDFVGRSDAVVFGAAGVANRPSLIPITFTAADETKRTGTMQGKPG